ncbi:hypothetical protein Avbf_18719 [Armadillidium vulgare]|nr:hypothetical protein Avbf_18719 [Armadillidium vulgare]
MKLGSYTHICSYYIKKNRMLDDTDDKLKHMKEEPFGVAEDSLDLELGSYADGKEESRDKTEVSFTKRKRLLSEDIESLTENNNNNNHNNNNWYSTNEQIFSTEGSNSSKDRLRRKRKKVLGMIKTNSHNDRIEQQEPLFKIVKKETLSNDSDSEEEISELNNGVYDSTEEEALTSAAEFKFNVEAQSDSFSSRPSYREKLLFSSNNRDDEDDNSLSNDNVQNERDRSSNSKMKIDFFRRKIKFKNKNKNILRDQDCCYST